jgi:hypothetical protein
MEVIVLQWTQISPSPKVEDHIFRLVSALLPLFTKSIHWPLKNYEPAFVVMFMAHFNMCLKTKYLLGIHGLEIIPMVVWEVTEQKSCRSKNMIRMKYSYCDHLVLTPCIQGDVHQHYGRNFCLPLHSRGDSSTLNKEIVFFKTFVMMYRTHTIIFQKTEDKSLVDIE